MTDPNTPRIGFTCAYTPLSLIHAAGYAPIRITPQGDAPEQAGQLLHDNLCPHVKRILDRGMADDLPEIDMHAVGGQYFGIEQVLLLDVGDHGHIFLLAHVLDFDGGFGDMGVQRYVVLGCQGGTGPQDVRRAGEGGMRRNSRHDQVVVLPADDELPRCEVPASTRFGNEEYSERRCSINRKWFRIQLRSFSRRRPIECVTSRTPLPASIMDRNGPWPFSNCP